ncbi:uncharacterized protein LOC125655225 isoform X2 [Ostrea edulis]|nr:uncharacterized protein LOC125655225 isoform X2 [Ostrea edulis]
MDSKNKFDLSGLNSVIKGFLHNPVIGEEMEDRLKKCSENADCRLSIMLDKRKKQSMRLCVMVKDSEACFTSTCTCPTSRRKRKIDSPVLGHNDDKETLQKHVVAECKFQVLENATTSLNKVDGKVCKNELKEPTSKPPSKDSKLNKTSTVNEETFLNQKRTKGNVTGFYLLSFFIGIVIGLFLGTFATCVYLKRQSKKPRTLSIRNDIYYAKRNTDTEITLNDTTEYSEIPEVPENAKTGEENPRDENCETSSAKSSQIRPYVNLHTSPSLLVHIDMHEEPYRESVPSTAEYTEPLSDMYFKLNTVSTDNDSKEQIMESGLSRSRERGTCDEDTAIEQSSVSTNYEYYKGTHQYYHLKDCPLVNSEQPLETDKGTCGNCNSKEDSNSSKPTYFVLKAVEPQPMTTKDIGNTDMLLKEYPKPVPCSRMGGPLSTSDGEAGK